MLDDDLMCTICGKGGGRVLPDPGTLPADTVMCLPCENRLSHIILGVPPVEPWRPEPQWVPPADGQCTRCGQPGARLITEPRGTSPGVALCKPCEQIEVARIVGSGD
jgi:hypothetical protein